MQKSVSKTETKRESAGQKFVCLGRQKVQIQFFLDNSKIYLKQVEISWVKMAVVSVLAVLNVLTTL
jgi:hypothetical protein